jgi:uncharacterized protein
MRIQVRVQPRASKEEVIKNSDENIKVYLKSAPVDGKANSALVRVLSEYFDVNKSKIRIITGKHSRNKIVEILKAG